LKHYASSRIWRCFNALPPDIQQLARKNFVLLRQDPTHRSLHFKTVNNGRYRSVRIGIHYRALGISVPDGVQWFWIGDHTEYDKLLA
jgi:hypothetical protein